MALGRAVAEVAAGGAIQEQVAPGQDKSTQDDFVCCGLISFRETGRGGGWSDATFAAELVVRSAEAMWNCSLRLRLVRPFQGD